MKIFFTLIIFFLTVNQMLFGQAPRIDSVTPSQGPIAGGTMVTIRGANFEDATLFMDRATITPQAHSATEICFTTPSHDNSIVALRVINSAGAAYAEFLYVPPKLKDLPPGYITTVMGMGQFSGFYRPATETEITPAGNPAYDRNGNLFIAEPGHNRVSMISPDGILHPFAGNGQPVFVTNDPGDGGPAIDAAITFPRSVTTDSNGNVYIADGQSRVRRVDSNRIITTIAGDGTNGFSGDGGPAISARLSCVSHITGDGEGTVYFIDFEPATEIVRIRKITPDGIITTVAGIGPPGFSGDGGPATQAQLRLIDADSGSLALDPQGNLYIAENGNNRIRKIDGSTGIITTFFIPPISYMTCWAVAADKDGNIYVGMENSGIYKISSSGEILTHYGKYDYEPFSEDGTPIEDSYLPNLRGLAVDSEGNILFTASVYNRIRRLNFKTGKMETIAGMGPRVIGENGPAIAATLNASDNDISFLPTGELIISDNGHHLLRKIDAAGNISTFATEVAAYAVEPDKKGNVYFTSGQIFRLDENKAWHLVAGHDAGCGFDGDGGLAVDASICQPWDARLDAAGNLFIADSNNNRIRRVDSQTGVITTVAGSGDPNGYEHYGEGTYCGDGGPATQACLNTPYGVALDSDGNLYIADSLNNRIRKVDSSGIISTFSEQDAANKLVFDGVGNLYTTSLVRYDRFGNSTRFAANVSSFGFSGDGGPAMQAQVRNYGQARVKKRGQPLTLDILLGN
jgi:sugar lactone lactonase YvrE